MWGVWRLGSRLWGFFEGGLLGVWIGILVFFFVFLHYSSTTQFIPPPIIIFFRAKDNRYGGKSVFEREGGQGIGGGKGREDWGWGWGERRV